MYKVFLLLLINICYASEKYDHFIALVTSPFLPIHKEKLFILSSIIKQKNEHKEDQLEKIKLNNCESTFYDCPKNICYYSAVINHLSFKNQQEIYKGLLVITKSLQQLPQELVHYIISYIPEYDIQQLGSGFQAKRFFDRRVVTIALHPLSLLSNYYYISHYSLFALIKELTFYKSKENNRYCIGWPPFFIELNDRFTPHIKTYLALANNTNLEETFKSDNSYYAITNPNLPHCSGKLLFLYFSGIDNVFRDFERNCLEKSLILSKKQIYQKASQRIHHTLEDNCIWCDLYREKVLF